MIKKQLFREDLYFRINIVPIELNPLRNKKDDIPILVHSFLQSFCNENNIPVKCISERALKALMEYNWPGNIRELKNIVERLIILSGQNIDYDDIPIDILKVSKQSKFMELTLKEYKEEKEREYIIHLLKIYDGNISKVSNILNIERTYLHRKIKDHKIEKYNHYK